MRRWDEVERELFPAGDEEKVQALEERLALREPAGRVAYSSSPLGCPSCGPWP